MNRYAPIVEKLRKRLGLELAGIGILVVPPGEHALVARALEPLLPGAVAGPLEAGLLKEGPARWLVTGLPHEREQAEAALTELNGRRNWIADRGRLLVLLLTNRELVRMQRLAGDVYSARLFLEDVPFVPDAEVNLESARAELAGWQRNRLGRLDLRGFARSESEDVSWRVEDIYQELHASYTVDGLEAQAVSGAMPEGALTQLLENLFRVQPHQTQPIVLLGHPGSGKTFLLRWLAVAAVERKRLLGLERPLPLLTSLSAYAQRGGLGGLREHFIETLLEEEQPAAHVLERAIVERRALFLLDGLDEVGDASSRRPMASAIQELVRHAPGCPVIVTSRIAGYDAQLSSLNFFLSPFTDEAIEQFLIRWCELYALDRNHEDTPQVRQEGRAEGERLARDVLAHDEVCELARSPLLLTVLAMVHRAGVRLPDHRVELYEHVTRILVERWNRVRSLSRQEVAPPLKAADAVRLLGPVALETMRSGTRGALPEDNLRRMLERALASGNLRGLASAQEALELFKNSLGLLVERGPGLYAFLHLTLAEYFAARELVRSGELERMAAEPSRAFQPEWREVLLLAAGELGIIRADDERLDRLVDLLLESARRSEEEPDPSVPSLLGGLLADDPGLSTESAEHIIQALIPGWWFSHPYATQDLIASLVDASALMSGRLIEGRLAKVIQARLRQHFGDGAPAETLENLLHHDTTILYICTELLELAQTDYGPLLIQALSHEDGPSTITLPPDKFFTEAETITHSEDSFTIRFTTSKSLDHWARTSATNPSLRLVFVSTLVQGRRTSLRTPLFVKRDIPWEQTRYTGGAEQHFLGRFEVRIPREGPLSQPVSWSVRAYIVRAPRPGSRDS